MENVESNTTVPNAPYYAPYTNANYGDGAVVKCSYCCTITCGDHSVILNSIHGHSCVLEVGHNSTIKAGPYSHVKGKDFCLLYAMEKSDFCGGRDTIFITTAYNKQSGDIEYMTTTVRDEQIGKHYALNEKKWAWEEIK